MLNPVRNPRSIPARTGEPYPSSASRRRRRVYPRAYGGTASVAETRHAVRSIPARTGEPFTMAYEIAGRDGLSPRVRGNRQPARTPLRIGLSPRVSMWSARARSIPARTGEPLSGLILASHLFPAQSSELRPGFRCARTTKNGACSRYGQSVPPSLRQRAFAEIPTVKP